MENIKKFIEEGEKEFDKKFYTDYGNGIIESNLCHDKYECDKATDMEDIKELKQFISSRQISLIKMIVEMVESEKKEEYLYHDEDYHSNHECDVWIHNQALDTISSKLSSLVNGEK